MRAQPPATPLRCRTLATVASNAYRLTTTRSMGAMPCAAMSASCCALPRTPSRPPWILGCSVLTRPAAAAAVGAGGARVTGSVREWRAAHHTQRRRRRRRRRPPRTVLDLREARVVRDVRHGEPRVAQRLGGAARRQQLDAARRERRAQLDEPRLVRDAQQRRLDGDVVRLGALDRRDDVRPAGWWCAPDARGVRERGVSR
jgi:hypothetical protein